jgi:hypothetical protein
MLRLVLCCCNRIFFLVLIQNFKHVNLIKDYFTSHDDVWDFLTACTQWSYNPSVQKAIEWYHAAIVARAGSCKPFSVNKNLQGTIWKALEELGWTTRVVLLENANANAKAKRNKKGRQLRRRLYYPPLPATTATTAKVSDAAAATPMVTAPTKELDSTTMVTAPTKELDSSLLLTTTTTATLPKEAEEDRKCFRNITKLLECIRTEAEWKDRQEIIQALQDYEMGIIAAAKVHEEEDNEDDTPLVVDEEEEEEEGYSDAEEDPDALTVVVDKDKEEDQRGEPAISAVLDRMKAAAAACLDADRNAAAEMLLSLPSSITTTTVTTAPITKSPLDVIWMLALSSATSHHNSMGTV